MRIFVYTVLSVFLAAGAEAVIVAGGDGTQNTMEPSGGQGWDYVGRIDDASKYSSVTYISNNWFITAYHVKDIDDPTGVIIGGAAYSIDPNSWTRLQNSIGGDADLIMFRVVGGTIALPAVTVRSTNLPNNSNVTMIGNGRNQESSETTWNVLWEEGGLPTFYTGYKWAPGSTKRWGTNKKDNFSGRVDSGFGVTDMIRTDFDDVGGSEAQGAAYDSGGGVFHDNGSAWELVGIMITVGIESGQPWPGTAVYNNNTYSADMKYYATQIISTAAIDDLDEDGLPDGWEYDKSGNSTGVVASADQDGDGYTGEQEWVADTNPFDGNSYFRMGPYTNATSLIFTSSTNREYKVEFRLDLADTNETWQVEPGLDWFTGSPSQTVSTVTAPDSNRFYRVRARL